MAEETQLDRLDNSLQEIDLQSLPTGHKDRILLIGDAAMCRSRRVFGTGRCVIFGDTPAATQVATLKVRFNNLNASASRRGKDCGRRETPCR